MSIEFDPAKDAHNIAKHGLSLADFQGFDDEPVVIEDDRADYGEVRYRAFGRIDGKGRHCLHPAPQCDPFDQLSPGAREGDAAL